MVDKVVLLLNQSFANVIDNLLHHYWIDVFSCNKREQELLLNYGKNKSKCKQDY